MNPFKSGWSPIGLDIGWREVRAVQVKRAVGGMGGGKIRAGACLARAVPGAEPTVQEMTRVLGALRRQGFVGDRVVACVPANKTLSAVLELPARSSGAPLDMIAKQELARTARRDANEIEMHWWELPPQGGVAVRGAGTSALALGCSHADATALLDALEPAEGGGSATLDVLALDAAPAALVRACGSMIAGTGKMTAILNVLPEAAQVLIVSGGTIVYERTLAEAGLRLLVSGIANQLSSDEEAADFMLREHGCREPGVGEEDPAAEARALIAAHADALASEILASLNYASRRFDAATGSGAAKLLVVGSGADIPGLTERIGARAGLETVMARADALCPSAGVGASVLGPGAVLALGLALHGDDGGAR